MRKLWLVVLAISLLCVGAFAAVLALLPKTAGEIANTPAPLPTRKPEIANIANIKLPTPTTVLATVLSTGLHVRSGPSTDYPVTGWLHRGDAVTVLACRNGWAKLAAGFVNAVYLSDEICKEKGYEHKRR